MANFFEQRKQILSQKLTRQDYKQVFGFLRDILRTSLTRRDLVVLAAACLLSAAYSVLLPLINRNITDYAVRLYDGGDQLALTILIILIVLLPLLSLLMKGLDYVNSKVLYRTMKQVDIGIKERVMHKMARVQLGYFNDPDFADRQYFINLKAAGQVYRAVTGALLLVSQVVGLVAAWGVIIVNYPIAGLICFIAAVPLIFLANNTNQQLYFTDYWEVPEYRRMEYAFELMTAGEYAQERFLYDYGSEIEKRFDREFDSLKTLRNRTAFHTMRNQGFSQLISTAALAVVLLLVTRDIVAASLTVGVFSLMVSAVQTFFANAQNIAYQVFRMQIAAKYGKSVLEMEALEDEPTGQMALDTAHMDIRLEDVHFTYPGTDTEVIRGLTLDIKHGEKVALVGRNGCGKSTLVMLLTGLYTPTKGRILVNGQDLSACLDAVRRATACVFQKFNQYQLSIAENVLIGDTTREVSREELERVCDEAGITAFAKEFPHGLDTILGDLGEEGANLSGGQWQRVMMARALIRKHASLLLFDEPTAALDPKSEAELYRDFGRLTGSRTTLTISHRLGITGTVDRILVMDEGQIVEDGTHEELMARGGLYARMFQSQAQWYQ